MAHAKATFTLDRATVDRLRRTAERLGRPKSEVVRLAIHDYSDRVGRLSERERLQKLRAIDRLVARIPSQPQADVDAEIAVIRKARRSGGRKGPSEAR